MTFICKNCGVASESAEKLCRPSDEGERNERFCGDNRLEVCDDNIISMAYTCDSCNSVSVSPENLCKPSNFRK